ncbi:MAG: hypothetical protein R3195_10575 [Gemmatimonadota bacterium]|nr:hypothetical protein [Gemmatimonadota bacterium]
MPDAAPTPTASHNPLLRPTVSRAVVGLAAAGLAAGCGGDEETARLDWEATRDTVGDTIIVRTVAGSVWGKARLVEELRIGQFDGPEEYTFGQIAAIRTGADGTLYVLDQQPASLRAYSPEGEFMRQLAGHGEGPGEINRPDAGLAILPDGRILVRDPAGARISVFGADGGYETEWRIRGGSFTSTPLYVDRTGHVYQQLFEFDPDGSRMWLVRHSPAGEPIDTLPVPQGDAPQLMAVNEGPNGTSSSSTSVPFWPVLDTELSPDGAIALGYPATYSIVIPRTDRVLRIERAFEPVPVLDDERDNRRERTIHNMRRTEAGWNWDGPDIPDTKPAFRSMMFDEDGRLWVLLYTRAERIPDEEIEPPEEGTDAPPPTRWREPSRFDVFESDGSYLGRLELPRGFSIYPRPAIRGDRVWAVVLDELDVPYLVRYRIEVEPPRP